MGSPTTDGSADSETANAPRSWESSGRDGSPGRVVVVSGPSGVGKSTLIAALREQMPFHFSVSATTRPPRRGEADGVDYLFVSEQDFERMRAEGELWEWAEYSGRLYGTPRAPALEHLSKGEDVLLDIEVQGAMQIKEAYPEAITVFIAPPSLEELERRLRARGDTGDEQIRRRLEIAQFQLETARSHFDHVVVNDRVSDSLAAIHRILWPRNHDSSPD